MKEFLIVIYALCVIGTIANIYLSCKSKNWHSFFGWLCALSANTILLIDQTSL